MPLRRFRAVNTGRCPDCKEGLEIQLRTNDDVPDSCPTCGAPITMEEAQTVNSPTCVRKPGTVQSKDAGFDVYKRNMDGTYNKQ